MDGFIKMAKYAGMREDLVQAGGGNSAYKMSNDRMAIKASGVQLADVSCDSGYSIVNHELIRDSFMNTNNLNEMTEEESKIILANALVEGGRPSIETFLHSISGKYSLHTHPVVVNALASRIEGDKIIRQLFPEALVIQYKTPGVELAKAYFKEYKNYKQKYEKEPQYIFLMNHGLLVSADTAEEVIELTEKAEKIIEDYLGVDYSGYHVLCEINSLYPNGVTWLVEDKNIIDCFTRIGGIWEHCFCPDCVVFLGKKIYEAEQLSKNEFMEFVNDFGYPVVVRYKSWIYIHAESVKKALEIQSVLSFSAQVMLINNGHECNFLSETEKNYLLNWDAEKYRKEMK